MRVVYAKGESIVQQGCLCRYMGIVKSGDFKYVVLSRCQLHRVREAKSAADTSGNKGI